MNKPNLLIFFQVEDLQRQYKELFPYYELSKDFNFKEFGRGKNLFKNTELLNLGFITRKVHALLHLCELERRKFTSISYLDRALSYVPDKFDSNRLSLMQFKKKNLLEQFIIFIFSNSFSILGIQKILNLLFKFEYLIKTVPVKQFDLIILPYTGGISAEWDFLVWAGKKNKVGTIGIQENWDNLSSKSFLKYFPSIFLVWGDQSGSHLRTYQQYQGTIVEVGAMRLQELFEQKKLSNQDNYQNKLNKCKSEVKILYIDSASGESDVRILEELSNYLANNSNTREKLEIIYRTHPKFNNSKLQKKVISKIKLLPHIKLYEREDNESNFDRIEQIMNSDIIISKFSTYILEGAIVDKLCIIPTFVDSFDKHSIRKVIDDVPHFQGMSMLSRVKTAGSFGELIDVIETYDRGSTAKLNDLNILNWFCKDTATKSQVAEVIKNYSSVTQHLKNK
jgi:hypothetical protein